MKNYAHKNYFFFKLLYVQMGKKKHMTYDFKYKRKKNQCNKP